jgi:hypothetical protein
MGLRQEDTSSCLSSQNTINILNAELNTICHLLALLGAHPILHVSRIRVKEVNQRFRDCNVTEHTENQICVSNKREQHKIISSELSRISRAIYPY